MDVCLELEGGVADLQGSSDGKRCILEGEMGRDGVCVYNEQIVVR